MLKLILPLIFTLSSLAHAAPELRSEYLRQLVYKTIDKKISWAGHLDAEELGSIWLGDIGEATFEVLSTDTDGRDGGQLLNVYSTFICGTEYDESELSGSCEVQLKKLQYWKVNKVGICVCE